VEYITQMWSTYHKCGVHNTNVEYITQMWST